MTADERRRLRALAEAGDIAAAAELAALLLRSGEHDDELGKAIVRGEDPGLLTAWLERLGALDRALLVVAEAFDLPPVPDAWRVHLVATALGVETSAVVVRLEAMRARGWIEQVDDWLPAESTPERYEGVLEGVLPDLEVRWSRVPDGALRSVLVALRQRAGSALRASLAQLIETWLFEPLARRANSPEVMACRGARISALNDPLHPFARKPDGSYGFSTNWMARRAFELSDAWSPTAEVLARLSFHLADSPVLARALAEGFEQSGTAPPGLRRALLVAGRGPVHLRLVEDVLEQLVVPSQREAACADLVAASARARGRTAQTLIERLVYQLCGDGLPVALQAALVERAVDAEPDAMAAGWGHTLLWTEMLRPATVFDASLDARIEQLCSQMHQAVRGPGPPAVCCDALSLRMRERLDEASSDAVLTDAEVGLIEHWASHPETAPRLSAAALWRDLETNPWPRLAKAWHHIQATNDEVVPWGDQVHRALREPLRTARVQLHRWLTES